MNQVITRLTKNASNLFRAACIVLSTIATILLMGAFSSNQFSWVSFSVAGVLAGIAHHFHVEAQTAQEQRKEATPWGHRT